MAAGGLVAAVLAGAQLYTNRPPHRSVDDYLAKRAERLGTTPMPGRAAKVGWQQAR